MKTWITELTVGHQDRITAVRASGTETALTAVGAVYLVWLGITTVARRPTPPGRRRRYHRLERWFAEQANRKLRRPAHRSVTGLDAGIRTWINGWNSDPKSFVWTKTADETLETIAACCPRINDLGHQRGK